VLWLAWTQRYDFKVSFPNGKQGLERVQLLECFAEKHSHLGEKNIWQENPFGTLTHVASFTFAFNMP
jgi:hypothetical protein